MTAVFQRLGPYDILEEIGRGGMAAVFLAVDTRTSRRLALKLVPTGSDREAAEILEAEQWGARLQEQFCRANRHVPQLYEYGTEGGYFYIAMEYLEGRNLSEILASDAMPPERAVAIAIELCEFLEAAHAFAATIDGRNLQSIVHGDLKPRNIRISNDGRVRILDFGIAKALSLSRKVTRNDFGTTPYLSPELLDTLETDAHSDLWALGVLLYEMVSGAQPFQAPDTRRLERMIRDRRPPAPLADDCPPPLTAVIGKLLAGTVAKRYETAAAIRQDLQAFQAGQLTQAEREGWPAPAGDEPATRRTRRPEDEQEPTRRTVKETPTVVLPQPARPVARTLPGKRHLRVALVLFALAIVGNEIWVGVVSASLAGAVATQELGPVNATWNRFDSLRLRSLRIGTLGLEHSLAQQTAVLADRVIVNYRTPLPTVRETQWRMAREALAHAVSVDPDNALLKASLRYCDGHLHRINGDARKARGKNIEAQHEFTDAVTAFREAAELRPNWPDPFLGLARTFIYGLEDVDRGADALQQAQRLGYTAGDRETAQLADGYRVRAEALSRTARTLSGMAQEEEYFTRSAEAFRQAVELYSKVLSFAGVPRNLRQAQRELKQVEQQLNDLSHGTPSPPAPPAGPPLPAPKVGTAALLERRL
jgi:predicted Ser/Thr protein kinase